MSRHRDVGTHEQKHEAAWLVPYFWGQKRWEDAQRKRQTVWHSERPIPLGVTEVTE